MLYKAHLWPQLTRLRFNSPWFPRMYHYHACSASCIISKAVKLVRCCLMLLCEDFSIRIVCKRIKRVVLQSFYKHTCAQFRMPTIAHRHESQSTGQTMQTSRLELGYWESIWLHGCLPAAIFVALLNHTWYTLKQQMQATPLDTLIWY